jgi:hypothetical protein
MWRKEPSRLLFGALGIFTIIALGFLRDFIFININYIIDQLYFNLEVHYYHSFYSFLDTWEVQQLMTLKWIFTLIFMGLNFGLSFWIIHCLFSNPKPANKMLIAGYLILFSVSAGFYMGGKLLGFTEMGYTLARRFMGVLQSPVPIMFVSLFHMVRERAKVGLGNH